MIALVTAAVFVFGSDDGEADAPTATTSDGGTSDETTPPATAESTTTTVPIGDDDAEDDDGNGDDNGDGDGATAYAGQVDLVSFTEIGDGPFTKPVAAQPSDALVAYAGAGGANAHDPSRPTGDDPTGDDPTGDIVPADADRSGAVEGLYTGRPDEVVCEVDELLVELQADSEIAGVWADIAGIDVDGIEAYLTSLTAVLTATDVRVTDHGLVDGRAEPRQAVLQVGTAILIDEFGVPAVRCQSGSPLRPPMPVDGPVRYAGGKWETFFPERTIAVSPAPDPVEEFVLVDYETGDTFARPVGSNGAAPIVVTPDDVLAEGHFLPFDEIGFVEDAVQIVFPPTGGEAQATWYYVASFEGVSVTADAAGPGVYDPVTGTMTGTGTATVSGPGVSNTDDFTWNAVVDPVAGTIVGEVTGTDGGSGAFELTFEPYETE